MTIQEKSPIPRDELEFSHFATEARERLKRDGASLFRNSSNWPLIAMQIISQYAWLDGRPKPFIEPEHVFLVAADHLSRSDCEFFRQAFNDAWHESRQAQDANAAERDAEKQRQAQQAAQREAEAGALKTGQPDLATSDEEVEAELARDACDSSDDDPMTNEGESEHELPTEHDDALGSLVEGESLRNDAAAGEAQEASQPEAADASATAPLRILEWALVLAAKGIPVFACNAKKRPLTANGFKDATRDPERIKEQFSRPGAVLVGVPTGEISGIDAVDIDNGKKKNLDGLTAKERVEAEARIASAEAWWIDNAEKFGSTRIHETQSGGLHLIVKHVAGWRNWTNFPVPGIDFRGDGGYIIWWPSAGCRVADSSDTAEAPAVLRELHERHRAKLHKDRPEASRASTGSAKSSGVPPSRKRAESYFPDAVGKALDGHRRQKKGSRHDYLIRNGAWLVRLCLGAAGSGVAGYSPGWLHDELFAAYEANGHIPEDGWRVFERAWETVAAWGEADGPWYPEEREREKTGTGEAGAKTDWPSEGWPPLDLSLLEEDDIPTPHLRDAGLPPSITSLARDIAGATLSPDYTLAAIMTSTAGLIGFSRVAYIPHSTWHRHASHYICLVGVPSSTKTASSRDIINILAKLDAETMKANEPKVAQWKADDEAHKAAHDAWRDSLRRPRRGEAPPAQPIRTLSETPPPPARLLVANITMQRLVALLRDNPMGLILVRDEIEAFFGDMGRYGGSGADRGDYLTLWAGVKLTFDRVKEGGLAITVPRPALSLLGGAQPDKLRVGLLNETDDGMFSRFDFIWPEPPPVGSLFDARKAAAGLASLEAVFRRLMAMRMEPEPVQLPLTPEAAVFFDGLQQELTKQARVEDGLMAGWLGKGPLKVLSYALVIEHLVHGIERAPLPTAVSLSAIEAAASYLRGYLQPMALKTIWLTGSDQKRGLAVKVAATIKGGEPPFKGKTFSEREMYQTAGFSQLRDESTREAVMKSLADAGLIRRLKTGTKAVVWEINPKARPA